MAASASFEHWLALLLQLRWSLLLKPPWKRDLLQE
jgi:hypothetical protein